MRRIAATLVLVLAAGGCGGETSEQAGPTASPSPRAATASPTPVEEECVDLSEGGKFTLAMQDDFFDPDCLVVSGRQNPTIVNEGIGQHTFTIDGTMVDVTVLPGDTFRGEVLPLDPGTYEFICRFHVTQGMVGEITVT